MRLKLNPELIETISKRRKIRLDKTSVEVTKDDIAAKIFKNIKTILKNPKLWIKRK